MSSRVRRVHAGANDLEGEFDACIVNRRDWLTVSALERRVLRACLARVLSRDLHKGTLQLHASTLAELTALRCVASMFATSSSRTSPDTRSRENEILFAMHFRLVREASKGRPMG